MTLTQPQRVSLGRLLSLLRADWDDAGVHDACVKLAGEPANPFQLCAQAIAQASVAGHRTPECISWTVKQDGPRLPGVRPEPTEPCAAHGGTIVRQDGVYHCCWIADRPVPARAPRRSRPAPPGIREQVAGSLRVKETETK